MSPENQWLGSMAFPIEIVSFWGVVSEKSPRKGKWTNLYGSFLKSWYPATMCFPTKNDHFGVEIGGTTI